MTDRALAEAEQWTGRDAEMDYLLERFPDGTLQLLTRPIGGQRWSRPVVLREAS